MSKQLASFLDNKHHKVGNDGGSLGATHGPANNSPGVILPYKPFTLQEVAEITGCPGRAIDAWVEAGNLPLQRGDDPKNIGLSYMQTFAVFVGYKWLCEGAEPQRASAVVTYVGNISREFMLQEFGKGNSFPGMVSVPNKIIGGPPEIRGIMVKTDMRNPHMRRLDLATHFDEFLTRLDKVFPGG